MAGVSETLANELYEEAIKLNMTVIVEVHTVEEAKKALKFKSALIGINNRNLKTLKTDINTTFDIHDVLKNHTEPLISESGIKTKEELLELSNKTSIKTFLIWCIEKNYLESTSLKSVKNLKAEKKLPNVLTANYINELLDSLPSKDPKDIRDKAILDLM